MLWLIRVYLFYMIVYDQTMYLTSALRVPHLSPDFIPFLGEDRVQTNKRLSVLNGATRARHTLVLVKVTEIAHNAVSGVSRYRCLYTQQH